KVVSNILANRKLFDVQPGTVLNVNVPSVDISQIRGIAVCKLGRKVYEQEMHENTDPRGRPYFWIGGGGDTYEPIDESDCKMLDESYVTVSVLRPSLLDEHQTQTLKNRLQNFRLG